MAAGFEGCAGYMNGSQFVVAVQKNCKKWGRLKREGEREREMLTLSSPLFAIDCNLVPEELDLVYFPFHFLNFIFFRC